MDIQPLFHLLRTLSDAVDQGKSEETAKRVIEYFSCTLDADACTLYLYEHGES